MRPKAVQSGLFGQTSAMNSANGTLFGKPAVRDYIEDVLGCARRWAQVLVSSWSSEGWMQRDALGQLTTQQTSLDHRIGIHKAHAIASPRENGQLGGRPTKQHDEGSHESCELREIFDRQATRDFDR
jgi:hypothetical protein